MDKKNKMKSFRSKVRTTTTNESSLHTKTNESPLSSSVNDRGAIVPAMSTMSLHGSSDFVSSDGDMESPRSRFTSNDSLLDSRKKKKNLKKSKDETKATMLEVNTSNTKLKSQSLNGLRSILKNKNKNKSKTKKGNNTQKQLKQRNSVTFAVPDASPTVRAASPRIDTKFDDSRQKQGDGNLTPTPTSPRRSDPAIMESNKHLSHSPRSPIAKILGGSIVDDHKNAINRTNTNETNVQRMNAIGAFNITPQNSLSVASANVNTPMVANTTNTHLQNVPEMSEPMQLDRQITNSETAVSTAVKLSVYKMVDFLLYVD